MTTLGPHIIFSDSRPAAWCYFKFDPSNLENPITFYTAPYSTTGGDITWTESPLEDRSPIYLYDTQEQKPCCYVMDANNLYDVPQHILGGKPHANAMRNITVEDHQITKRLANGKQAGDYAIRVEHYPEPDNLSEISSYLPELPITEPVATPRTPSGPYISSDEAKALLDVTQCIRVASQTDWPLSADISPDQQIQVCRAIVGGSALAEDIPQSTEIHSNINAVRPYLFPSTINSLLWTSRPIHINPSSNHR